MDVEGVAFGALSVIEPMLQKIGLVEIINQHLPVDDQAEYDHGTILSILTAARLYSPVALSNVSEWSETSGADILWNVPPPKLNDDRLGRSLDAFFMERHSIMGSLALHVASTFDIPLDQLHYDPTHILFTGVYADATARDDTAGETVRSDGTLEPAHIISGNQNGRTGIRQQLELMFKTVKPPQFTMISDRGTFSVAHLLRLKEAGSDAICSVPWNDVKELFDKNRKSLKWKTASFLSLEQQRRREQNSPLAQEHYELGIVRHTFLDNASGESIKCRVIFVFSTADQKVVRQQRQKKTDHIKTELAQLEKSVAAGRYNKKLLAVTKRVNRAMGPSNAAKYFSWELKELTPEERKQLPPPTRGCNLPTHRFTWSYDKSQVAVDELDDGYSAIVTTVPASNYSCDRIFSMFREQNLVEHANETSLTDLRSQVPRKHSAADSHDRPTDQKFIP